MGYRLRLGRSLALPDPLAPTRSPRPYQIPSPLPGTLARPDPLARPGTLALPDAPPKTPPPLLLLPCAGFAAVGNSDQRTSSFGQGTDLLLFKSINHRLQIVLYSPHRRTDRVVICSQEVSARLVG